MILACHHICKSFGTDVILNDVSFHIEEHEKAAIVGINGAGKSTLLKIIMGELPEDSGTVVLAKGAAVGYLAQHQAVDSDHTIYEELREVKREIFDTAEKIRALEAEMKNADGGELEQMLDAYARLTHAFEAGGGYACESEIAGVLKGLGFTENDFSKQIATLSGGQKTRVALGKLLLSQPDILLLDEPTNHLDMESIAWLENFLVNYKGAVVIVAHDRYFLDKVASKIIEIDHHRGTVYQGNYSAYAAKRAILRNMRMKAWLNQQQQIQHQEAVIEKLRSFNREKSIKRAESRVKMLDKMERLEKPEDDAALIRLALTPSVTSGNDVLFVEHLTKSFDGRYLFKDLTIDIKRGEKVALIGNNGAGKTTILKILNRLVPADAGTIRLGSQVEIGYYDQEHQVLHMDKTIFQEISDAYPSLDNTRIRNVLAAFLFTGDDVFKPIGELSGGERGRVSLAKLMLSNANFLILDEPTNHLDIQSKEILEDAVANYTGTVFYVSHDRYFINQTATRVLDLDHGLLNSYDGNYDDYLEKKDHPTTASSGIRLEEEIPADSAFSSGKQDYKKQKEQQARERKLKNDLKKTEDQISRAEERIAALDSDAMDEAIATDAQKLMDIQKEKDALEAELEGLMEQWESLSQAIEDSFPQA